jgi:hypothetical protein
MGWWYHGEWPKFKCFEMLFFFLISDSLLTKAMLIKLVLIETSSMGLAMKLKFTSCSHPMQADVP